MAWRAWVATYNTVHSEDDIAVWMHPSGDYGVAVVADGVSATGSGGASFLAAQSFTMACRYYMRNHLDFETIHRCLGFVAEAARSSSVVDADIVASLKRDYYTKCSSGGKPCTEPLTLEKVIELKQPMIAPRRVERREAPSTTLLAAVFAGSVIGFLLLGDGIAMGMGTRREELWVSWGALPQYFQGARVARLVELGSGIFGRPVVLLTESEPGGLYVVATDGVDPAALAESLAELVARVGNITELENPAATLLESVKTRMGGMEDDASLAVIYHTG
ncbi:protein phosphatase 2C domain-containing protein [Hyperthermus butylicus]|uniref:PPM-type phosphatase domain-containing protein n=1 Tax=Hyperthermus butylicus (strain DSM 5456 / JCM 9403 / PLM1-5) TaxID=415426 RepID=A2BJG1_HYPBU|nr:protein phosphatase 2C domain-containing protein [Hyperthermus butylicus]ABM80122.1 hypothetical protein Hbut_0250 [Hyperthermus butylicus DSM 5456]